MAEQNDPNDHTQQQIISDLYHRMRFMEQNLPPRIQNLENAVTEIKHGFDLVRKEQQAAAKENHNALNVFRQSLERLSDQQEKHKMAQEEADKNTRQAIEKLGKRATFAAGAIWAAGGFVVFIIGVIRYIALPLILNG